MCMEKLYSLLHSGKTIQIQFTYKQLSNFWAQWIVQDFMKDKMLLYFITTYNILHLPFNFILQPASK
jgi:hypothetical protein